MWEVAVAHIGTEQFEGLLRSGWEPFGVTAVGNPSRSHNLYHFRRQLPGPTLMQSGNFVGMAQKIQEARDYTRTETLKEVGAWIGHHHSDIVREEDTFRCCYNLTKLRNAALEGEMP